VFTAGSAVVQSHYYVPYTPGRSQLSFTTFSFGTVPAAGALRRVGYYDDSNGIFLEQASTGITLNIRSGTTLGNQSVAQSAWNIDKLNGTGPSGFTLDLTKVQILYIQLQALYTGRVIVGFDIDGSLIPVHQFVHANRVALPYLQQASLPVRWEARSTTTGVDLNGICATVISEGGGDLHSIPGRTFGASNSPNEVNVTTRRPVLSLRAGKLLNALPFNGLILAMSVNGSSRTNPCYVELVRNPTLTGTAWSAVDSINSGAEVDTSATALTGGTLIWSNYIPKDGSLSNPIMDNMLSRLVAVYSHLLNTTDTLALVATSLNATAVVSLSINWKEIR
jgi:hypothetical protein